MQRSRAPRRLVLGLALEFPRPAIVGGKAIKGIDKRGKTAGHPWAPGGSPSTPKWPSGSRTTNPDMPRPSLRNSRLAAIRMTHVNHERTSLRHFRHTTAPAADI